MTKRYGILRGSSYLSAQDLYEEYRDACADRGEAPEDEITWKARFIQSLNQPEEGDYD